MRIDFVTSSLRGGGAERVMALLANHFVKIGHDVNIISFNEGEAYSLENKVGRIKLHKGKIKNHKIRALHGLYRHYKSQKDRPDLIIGFITQINLISILVAKYYKIPVIVSEHNSHLQEQVPKYVTRFTRDFIYRKANFVTVLTGFDIDFYKKKKANVVVMPNPCTFSPLKNNEHSREKIILAVGKLDRYHHKGFDNLIILMTPILKKHPEWKLKIIGGGDEGESILKAMIKDKGVETQVILAGFQTNVSEHMRKASIFILSSRFEGLPMVLLEAMSQGMACIAYDCKTGPADLITPDVNGILIKDQDQIEMQKGISSLIQRESLRLRLGEKAIVSLNDFSIESISSMWEELFKTIRK